MLRSLIFLLVFISAAGLVTTATRLRITSMSCSSDPQLCLQPICKMTPKNRFVKQITLSCTPVQPTSNLWIRIENFKRTSGGYQPGFVHTTMDFCAMMNRNTSSFQLFKAIMNNFVAGYMAKLEKFWFGCPVSTKWLIDVPFDERDNIYGPVAGVIPAGEYRAHFLIYTKDSNLTVFEWFYNFVYSK